METEHIIDEPTIAERALACLAVAFLIASVVIWQLALIP